MYQPFEQINLLKPEKKSLKTFRSKPRQKQEEIKCFKELWSEYGFIALNHFDYFDEYGEPFTDNTYSITRRYERYKVWRKKQRIIHLPNWVAITISLASLGLNILIWLWQLQVILQ